jgi:phosphoribosyl 1,2-cyclic phosphate phosphodiesterase
MKITVLGSGGNCTIPWILSKSKVSKEARKKGGKYVRTCPSFFIHDANILIESPETIFTTLDRENIQDVDHLFLSHPHPDHTYGLRFVQSLLDYQTLKPRKVLPLYMGEIAFKKFSEKFYPSVMHLWKGMKLIKPKMMQDRQVLKIKELKITWYCANKDSGKDTFAFLFEHKGKRVLFALDDVHELELYPEFYNLDLLIHECGWFDYKPNGDKLFFNSKKRWSEDIKFNETLKRVEELKPKKTILMNLEEIYERSYDDYLKMEDKYKKLNLKFAFDGMDIKM